MRFSNDVVAELKTRLLRTKTNGFKFTDAEAKDAASVLGLSVEQVLKWNQNVHTHYKPYEHEKESHMEKIEAFLSGAKGKVHFVYVLSCCEKYSFRQCRHQGHTKGYGKNVWGLFHGIKDTV